MTRTTARHLIARHLRQEGMDEATPRTVEAIIAQTGVTQANLTGLIKDADLDQRTADAYALLLPA